MQLIDSVIGQIDSLLRDLHEIAESVKSRDEGAKNFERVRLWDQRATTTLKEMGAEDLAVRLRNIAIDISRNHPFAGLQEQTGRRRAVLIAFREDVMKAPDYWTRQMAKATHRASSEARVVTPVKENQVANSPVNIQNQNVIVADQIVSSQLQQSGRDSAQHLPSTDNHQTWWQRAGIIAGIVGTVIAVATFYCHYVKKQDVSLASRQAIQPQEVPRLSVTCGRDAVHVGPTPGRIDEVVEIPMTVFNNSSLVAYDLVLDVLFSDGTGREAGLNEYFKSIDAPPLGIPRLVGGAEWRVPTPAISAPPNAKQLYASGKLHFKIKLQLTWKDGAGTEHKFVELASLQYVAARERYSDAFWFKPVASYNSVENPDELKNQWGLPFKF